MTATDTTSALEEILEAITEIQTFDVEVECEDLSGWPIPAWKIEDYTPEEISKTSIIARVWFEGYDCDALIGRIFDAATAAGITLEESGNARHRDGAQVNFTVVS